MIFVGIDPGKHGAIAWIDGEREAVEMHDCPLDGNDLDLRGMAALLGRVAKDAIVVTMELVHAMPTDGKCSAFTFGEGYGAWKMAVATLGLRLQLIAPNIWKPGMLAGLPKGKQASVDQAARLFPGVRPQLYGPRGGLRDGRAEALLLAEYGRRCWKLSGRPMCRHRTEVTP